MTMAIPYWQRILSIVLYMLPLSDSVQFGSSLFAQYPFLQIIFLPTIPIYLLERVMPFGSFLIFTLIFLFITRNPKIPYFLRFNSMQAILLNISVIAISFTFQILLLPLGLNLLIRTLSSTILICILAIIIFAIVECIKGKEPDLPGITTAVRMQI